MTLPPSLILFATVLAGAFAGFLSPFFISAWASLGALSLCVSLLPWRRLRALGILCMAFVLAAGLAKYRLNMFEDLEPKGGWQQFEGVVEEVTPTLLGGKKLRFKADAGYRLKVSLEDGAAMVPVDSGDRVRLVGTIKRLQPALMPGDFDARLLGIARGFQGRISVHSPFRIRVLQKNIQQDTWPKLRNSLREKLLEGLTPREAGVLLALIIGETDFFEDEQKQIYQNVGAGHLLAVSGLQVSCLSFLFFYFFRALLLLIPALGRLSRARTPAVFLTLISIWVFTALSGFSASGIRAAFMSSVLLLGLLLKRDASNLESFGIAGFMTVLLMPQSVLDPSFLFSYLAVFGLLVSGGILAGVLTLPLSAYYFGALAVGGLLANLILIPIAVFLQTPAIFLAVSGFLKPAAYFAGALEALCEALGDYVGGLWFLTPPSAWQVLFFMLALLIFVRVSKAKASVLLGLVLVPSFWPGPAGVHITVLPVGQGDASVFEFPNSKVMVIDSGPREDYLLSALRRLAISRIDILVLSHPDADHILGFFKVLQVMPVGEIWHSGFDEKNELMARFLALAHQKNIPIKTAQELFGTHTLGSAQVQVLHPQKFDVLESKNNNSLVLKISLGQDSALWPGDIESPGEQYASEDWKASVLKAPHHGSKSSSSDHLVSQVLPKQVIFCTQAQNQFGFPHAEVKTRWEQASAQTWDTGTQGKLDIWLTGSGVRVKSYRLVQ